MTARHRLDQLRLPLWSSAAVTWLPALVGVGILAGFMVYGITLRAAGDRPVLDARIDPATPIETGPPPTAGTPPPEITAPPTEPPASATSAPPTTHPPTPTVAPPKPDVIGEYHLEVAFPEEFTGKVMITNTTHQPQDWTVELLFPPSVGELREFWVNGAAPPKLRQQGDGYFFHSGEPLGAKSQLVLRVQFSRSGPEAAPSVCRVNDAPCLH